MTDFAFELDDHPGELARVATALSRYGINLRSVTGLALNGRVLVRILPDDADAARATLQAASVAFEEGTVVTALLENRAGELANLTNQLAEARVNLRGICVIGLVDNLVELAIVADDAEKAAAVVG